MERLTSNKKVSEMNMCELMFNSCYAKDGKARYRNFEEDFDARELTVKLLEKYADIPNDFTCDEDFDDFMADSLQYGTDDLLGLIAVFYQNLCAMTGLREQLKKYEDIGITPEQIREIDRLYAEKCKKLAVYQKKYINAETFLSTIENMWKVEQDLRLKLIEYKKCEKHELDLFEDALKKGENA